MAKRKIIKIDEAKCNGCGQCVTGCAEGALQIIDGKARLVNEVFCDGLGACIGECPTGALTIEEREADEFDESAAMDHVARINSHKSSGCPGSMLRSMRPTAGDSAESGTSQLSHWPVQLALVPPGAPFLKDADVLLVADCVPFAYPDLHRKFMAGGRPVLVACPKLDDNGPYVEKLTTMMQLSGMKSLTVVHMEVPCCGGLGRIVGIARQAAGSNLPIKDITISIKGGIIAEKRN